MPGLRRTLGVFLAALLLAAQQAALEHALWHVAAAEQSQKSDSGRAPLCEQHAALGAVAGAIGCAGVALADETPAAQAIAVAAASPAAPAGIAPTSRGPPALL
jgi:hypothetical protein